MEHQSLPSSSAGDTSLGSPSPSPSLNDEAAASAGSRKILWTEAETAALARGVARHGVGRWKQILRDADVSRDLHPSRTVVALKDRYRMVWGPRSKQAVAAGPPKPRRRPRTAWTEAEDAEMLRLYALLGPHWTAISKRSTLLTRNERSGTDVRDRMRNRYKDRLGAAAAAGAGAAETGEQESVAPVAVLETACAVQGCTGAALAAEPAEFPCSVEGCDIAPLPAPPASVVEPVCNVPGCTDATVPEPPFTLEGCGAAPPPCCAQVGLDPQQFMAASGPFIAPPPWGQLLPDCPDCFLPPAPDPHAVAAPPCCPADNHVPPPCCPDPTLLLPLTSPTGHACAIRTGDGPMRRRR
ncbi:hypothetical protein H9P43_003369 [Blastocladiella emersonii ATCC 22665]|nr:hypothetical protein H9P43_003369 [Blastocladiella emersonii ATCC 22665]